MKRFVFFKGNMGNLTDQISTQAKKISGKKNKHKIHFLTFIENRNSN